MLNIVVAHKAEASGVIEGLSLDPLKAQKSIYEGGDIRLCLSGQGYENSRRATVHLRDSFGHSGQSQNSRWLNFGIAGTRSRSVGSIVLGKSVQYQHSGQHWLLPDSNINEMEKFKIHTVVKPESNYQDEILYDMEAAGICAALSPAIQVKNTIIIKVISDNALNPLEKLNNNQIKTLLNNTTDSIIHIIKSITHAPES